MLKFLTLQQYQEVKGEEEKQRKEKGDEDKSVSAINPLRQPSIGRIDIYFWHSLFGNIKGHGKNFSTQPFFSPCGGF